ncbi:MAG: hydrogenase expression/formation protein HypE [Synechococcus sp.]|nr:hydrogenase expression/formation protein HypE [Synechococcus sp.]
MQPTCPIPLQQYPQVLLAHGGGGKLMQNLIDGMFAITFGKDCTGHDAATFPMPAGELALTTDSYVVQPLFFLGGDIGKLAIYGTVNDLAMAGARPLYLSVGLILEEGLPLETLWRIVTSMQQAAQEVDIQIVTGDTKVVERGKGDGIFINTSGVGVIESGLKIQPKTIAPGDVILVSGDLGRHGIAIMAQREGLAFETTIESDCAPLVNPVQDLLSAGIEVHCLRDVTRGGLASVLNELAIASGFKMEVIERDIPVREDVRGACEILGFDPLYVANEGRFVAFVPPQQADKSLEILRSHQANAQIIGQVTTPLSPDDIAPVTLKNTFGIARILDRLSGEQLPRIC